MLLDLLCDYRSRYFRKYPDVYAEGIERMRSLEESDGHSTKERREEQIKTKIYQLDEDVIRNRL